MTRKFVVESGARGSILVFVEFSDGIRFKFGSFYEHPGLGWRYIPNTTAGKSSRKHHPTALAAAIAKKLSKEILAALRVLD